MNQCEVGVTAINSFQEIRHIRQISIQLRNTLAYHSWQCWHN